MIKPAAGMMAIYFVEEYLKRSERFLAAKSSHQKTSAASTPLKQLLRTISEREWRRFGRVSGWQIQEPSLDSRKQASNESRSV